MIDRFGRPVKVGDIIVHVDGNKLFLGLVVEDSLSGVKYTLIQGENYYYGVYGLKSKNRVIVMEQTPEFMNSILRDYRGYPEDVTVGEATKYTQSEYDRRK